MFANRFTALIDACVLANALKRNIILSLEEAELFRPRWSVRFMEETEAAIEKILLERGVPDARTRATTARGHMEAAFEDATVSDYQLLESAIGELPDDKDRHVVAAAVKTKASIIVTDNLRDFPASVLGTHELEAKSADEFIADTIDLSTSLAIAALQKMRERLKRPEKTAEMLLLDMEKNGLTPTADALKEQTPW